MTRAKLEIGIKILKQKPSELKNPVLDKLLKELQEKLNKLTFN
mgnify:FL=1